MIDLQVDRGGYATASREVFIFQELKKTERKHSGSKVPSSQPGRDIF
jgi:hypothetical protein